MKAITIMFDTLSRRFLSTYGNQWVKTPNFKRLESHCTTFDQFYSGSLPCMPARRELHTGRYNFLHRGWGPLEPFDDSAIELLKNAGVTTHIVTDHNHYWEDGGATYLGRYSSWEGFRGQEGDQWVGIVDKDRIDIPNQLSTARKGDLLETFYKNCTRIQNEEDFSSVQTIQAGINFIEQNKDSDHWLLQIECFDPHEPFHVPQRFLDLYEEIPSDPLFNWPSYAPVCESEEEKRQVIIRYAALISMCDEYLGTILDVMDQHQLWDDTLLMVHTDHGFLMGEHNWWGKSVQPVYQEVAHLPFYLHVPHMQRVETKQLAQTIDIAPTLLTHFGVEVPKDMLGKPLQQVLETDSVIHEAILFGYFSAHVNVFDGTHMYMRSPIESKNSPLYEYTLMPTRMKGFLNANLLTQTTLVSECSFFKGMNVLKVPYTKALSSYLFGNRLYDITTDYEQGNPLDDNALEVEMLEKLRLLLLENEAPSEQYDRLGIRKDRSLTIEEVQQQKEIRQKNDTIFFSVSLTPKQQAQLCFLKTVLPTAVFPQVLSQLETLMKERTDLEDCIMNVATQLMHQSGVSSKEQEVFLRILHHANDVC